MSFDRRQLRRDDFAGFYAAVNQGRNPYPWQEQLLDQVLTGSWPEAITAPTGGGKTAVIDVHVFACALAASGHSDGIRRPVRLPRRLAMVVDRRALVDDQHTHARDIQQELRAALTSRPRTLLGQVADALIAQRLSGTEDRTPLIVARLRGGIPIGRDWVDHPEAVAVLCATPDMWGSRILFRGYGSSNRAWPREAGLLSHDSVVVIDEAHLSRQLVLTARRVSQLVAAEPVPLGPGLQVVENTATPSPGATTTLTISADDVTLIGPAISGPKTVSYHPTHPSATPPVVGRNKRRPAAPQPDSASELVNQAVRLHSQHGATVGVFTNTVATALAVARQFREEHPGLQVALVCGRMRGHDRAALAATGLLDRRGDPDTDVLVTTQVMEVGADIDLAACATELASGTALAQRAGRVNRPGRGATHTNTEIAVVGPDGPINSPSGPYQPPDLEAARAWVDRRAASPEGMAPVALATSDGPPQQSSTRTLFQRPELADAELWARTSDWLHTEPQLQLWLDDNLDTDLDAGIAVRWGLANAADPLKLARALPAQPEEVFPASLATVRAVIAALGRPTSIRQRGSELAILDDASQIRPGDIVLLDDSLPLFLDPTGNPGQPARAGVLVSPDPGQQLVSALDSQGWLACDRVGRMMLRLRADLPDESTPPGHPDPAAARLLVEQSFEIMSAKGATGAARHAVAQILAEKLGAVADPVTKLLQARVSDADVHILFNDVGQPVQLLVIDARRPTSDEDLRQVRSTSGAPVALAPHSDNVAERAAELAERLQLEPAIRDALGFAGQYHDAGKAHPRFQERLGNTDPHEPPLAKSANRSVKGTDTSCGLPTGWRHEQLSALLVPADNPDIRDVELVRRLVGTSHGLGRACFPHSALALLAGEGTSQQHQQAAGLFDVGSWDTLIENTANRYGTWGCAYLEALLRAADCQVSQEGR